MISTSNLVFQYTGRSAMQYPNLAVDAGQAMLILGKSGCGKTTLLHLLGGLQRPSEGQVFIHSQDITGLSEKKLDHFRGQHIGFIFQRSYFVQSLTVKDNILLSPYLAKKQADKAQISRLAESLGIGHLLHKLPATLSQGEQQRVSIARAIVHQPDLVLADEPTSSLDDENTAVVAGLLLQLCRENGAALVVVTHDERLKNLIAHQITLVP